MFRWCEPAAQCLRRGICQCLPEVDNLLVGQQYRGTREDIQKKIMKFFWMSLFFA